MMERILYTTEDCWGNTYLFKRGYKRIISNMDEIETPGDVADDWIARYYYVDKKGNVFLKCKKGRKLKIEINPKINFFSEDYMVSIKEEIECMDKMKKEMQKVYPKLEKMI